MRVCVGVCSWWRPGWPAVRPAYLALRQGVDAEPDPAGRTHAADGRAAGHDGGRERLPAAAEPRGARARARVVHLAVGRGQPLGRRAAAHLVRRREQPELGLAVEVPGRGRGRGAHCQKNRAESAEPNLKILVDVLPVPTFTQGKRFLESIQYCSRINAFYSFLVFSYMTKKCVHSGKCIESRLSFSSQCIFICLPRK